MVGEFPELQGTMGRTYALLEGEPPRVADALRDHYCPVGADGAVASDDVARVVALADRLDTLTGCFAVGLAPTGAADPFALRRACIGLLRTLLEGAPPAYGRLGFGDLVRFAHGLFAGTKLDLGAGDTAAKLEEFATERMRGLLETQSSRAAADAVLAGYAWVDGERAFAVEHPAYALAKARALQAVIDEKTPWLEKARTVAKRLSGISKEASPERAPRSAFTRPTDGAIVDVVEELDAKTASLVDEHGVRAALFAMGKVAEQVDAIFESTLVNDPDDPQTPLRLCLLSYGATCMLRIADFARLA